MKKPTINPNQRPFPSDSPALTD